MRNLLFVLLGSFALSTSGQNYFLSSFDTVKCGNPGDLFLPSVTVNNATSNALSMMVRRIVRNVPNGWNSCFCYPYCVPQTQDTLYFTLSPALGKDSGFMFVSPNFGTDSVPGIGVVTVVITDLGTGQCDTVTYRGITTASALHERSKLRLSLFPNPCSDHVFVEGLPPGASLLLYDAAGKLLSRHEDGGALDVSLLCPGLYSLVAVGRTGKLLGTGRFARAE
jgi:hypothetical protein